MEAVYRGASEKVIVEMIVILIRQSLINSPVQVSR